MARSTLEAAAKRCSSCLTLDQKSLLSRQSTVRKSSKSFATRDSTIIILQIVISKAPYFKTSGLTIRVRFGFEELGQVISFA